MDSVYVGLALYSGVSTLMILYSLLWYIRLVKRNLPGDGQETSLTTNDG